MLSSKKRRNHADGGGDGEVEQLIDFAWILYIGMNKLGFSEWEVEHMYFSKWSELFFAYQKCFNAEHRPIYKVGGIKKKVSLLSL